jgi:prephenate dehydrogenase
MSVQVTIIGLGQIGASIGLALKAHNVDIYRVGHDKDQRVAKEAQKLGAVDEVKYNLPASVSNAQIVILALPLSAVRETLEYIALDLQERVLILDTAPAKARVAAWAKELIPPGRYYMGLTPAINPEYLHETEYGVKAARADLFEKGLMVVNAPPGTPEAVFDLTMQLVNLLGASPLLMDLMEADGIFSAMHTLPQLASAALLDATVDQPGWHEARKLAGRPYAIVTAGVGYHDDMASLGESALGNRENVVRLLDTYISSLVQLRDEIEANDSKAVNAHLEALLKGRNRWLEERTTAQWVRQRDEEQVDTPSFTERMAQMFVGSTLRDRQKQRK